MPTGRSGCRPRRSVLLTNMKLLKFTTIMNDDKRTVRLLYPQWQGGVVAHWMPDVPPEDAARGYYLGAHLLAMLAPPTADRIVEVPVALDGDDRAAENGISGYRAILRQTEAALALMREYDPDRIVTLGGECSVSVVPFTYLASKYGGDVAVVWIDAHPDVTLPFDGYEGYHAMALTACLGLGDPQLMRLLPAKFDASKALIVGVRSWDDGMKRRQEELGVAGLAPAEVRADRSAVSDWLRRSGASKAVVHFDLDVLDPSEIVAGVGVEPDGLRIDEAVRIIRDIAAEHELVGLTVAEPMPRVALKLRNMLAELPLMK